MKQWEELGFTKEQLVQLTVETDSANTTTKLKDDDIRKGHVYELLLKHIFIQENLNIFIYYDVE